MKTIEQLKAQRHTILRQFANVGDFRPGSLSENYRKCGRPSCRCARQDGPGHPAWLLTRKVKGKSANRHIPNHALETTRQQVEQYHHFMDLVRQYAEVNDAICELRLHSKRQGKKKL